jgi:hypothetical protein
MCVHSRPLHSTRLVHIWSTRGYSRGALLHSVIWLLVCVLWVAGVCQVGCWWQPNGTLAGVIGLVLVASAGVPLPAKQLVCAPGLC